MAQRRDRFGGPAALSALLHALVLAGLILAARERVRVPHWLPPPSVRMLFQGGGAKQAAVPNPATRRPHRPASPAPVPVPVVRPAPAPVAPPVPPTPRAVPLPPLPREVPASPSRPVASPPPAAVARPGPGLPLPPPRPAVPRPPAPRLAPRFPAPMRFSLGGAPHAPSPPRAAAKPARGIDLSFAPHGGGAEQLALAGILNRDGVGPDWSNAFSAWLAKHSYYPRDAGILGEHGDVVVRFVVSRDGRVTGLHLEQSSGHPILDMATLGLFRGAHLPPLPPQDGVRLPIRFTMHYVIR